MERTASTIASALATIAPSSRFFVALRLYHGWYKGWEPTENFRAVTTTVSETRFVDLSQKSNVIFSADVEYGHTLLSALPHRLHTRPAIHLPNTLRQQNKHLPPAEKMVDTALATDLLEWARSDPQDWALILAEDDDLVPPVLAAEAWIKRHGGRVLIIRTRRSRRTYLKLSGLLMELN